MIAEGGGVVPPGSGAGADEEPENAGRGAVEKDMSVRMHCRREDVEGYASLPRLVL